MTEENTNTQGQTAEEAGVGSWTSPQFEGALSLLRSGKKVSREGWNGKGQYIALQTPDENSANTLPYIYIVTVQGKRVPWVASQTDLLAEDWKEVI